MLDVLDIAANYFLVSVKLGVAHIVIFLVLLSGLYVADLLVHEVFVTIAVFSLNVMVDYRHGLRTCMAHRKRKRLDLNEVVHCMLITFILCIWRGVGWSGSVPYMCDNGPRQRWPSVCGCKVGNSCGVIL